MNLIYSVMLDPSERKGKSLVRNVLSNDVGVFLVPCGRLVAGYFMGGTRHKCGVAHSLG